MSKRAVVFDTNAYRDLCRAVFPEGRWTIEKIRDAEAKHSLFALASPFVIMELVSHLHEQNNDANECRCGLTSLVRHCSKNSPAEIGMLADTGSLIDRSYFDIKNADNDDPHERLRKLSILVARSDPTKPLNPDLIKVCREEIHEHLGRCENDFIDLMQTVIKTINPKATAWHFFEKK
ncbi:MAG: hypothetical protein HZA50_02495 [Planctomycetes bacterium]|nr:hypothetical protein [Planctomycetota bacterium]